MSSYLTGLNDDSTMMEMFDRQELLFSVSPTADCFESQRGSLGSRFNQRGYHVWHDIPTIQRAVSTAMGAIGALALREPYAWLGAGKFRLAKADRTPVCDAIVDAEFQSLHFDYGFPILHGEQQALYGFAALYCPPDSRPSGAETRIVPLRAPRNAARRPAPAEAAACVRDYARAHGDGWLSPLPANTGRISMLLRFLDAASGQRRFASLIDCDSANFIGRVSGQSGSAESYLEKEQNSVLTSQPQKTASFSSPAICCSLTMSPSRMAGLGAVNHGSYGTCCSGSKPHHPL